MSTTRIPGQNSESKEPIPIPTLTVLAHPNWQRIGECFYLADLSGTEYIELSRGTPDFAAPGKSIGKPLLDGFLSRSPLRLRVNPEGGIDLDTSAYRAELRIASQPFRGQRTFSLETLTRGVSLCMSDRVVLFLHLSFACPPQRNLHGMVGFSDVMNHIREEIEKVADLTTPILLRGPSGSGKELAAKAIHNAGDPKRPFIAVNMGSLPQNLAATELFGAVKGAFTGSDRHQLGFFRAASGGTLFLDEIGEASPEVQVLLLRALETGEVTPVGSQQSYRADVRFIAATDANLEAKMAEDSFKAPLFHRLAGYEIALPPLRDRLEDFGVLFRYFVDRELSRMNHPRPPISSEQPWLPASLVEGLLSFHWPGNVRQLANAVRQLVIGCRGEAVLRLVPKVSEMLSARVAESEPQPADKEPNRKPSDITGDELKEALRANQWSPKSTAQALGISKGSLYQLIEKTPGIQKAGDLGAVEIQEALTASNGDDREAANRLLVSARALRRRITELGLDEIEST